VSKKKSTKKVKSAKSKPSKPTPTKKPSATAKTKKPLTLSFAKLSAPLLSNLDVSAAAAAAIKAVAFANDNANVKIQVTTAGQSDIVPCTLNLPVGIFPLHFQSQGSGNFNVTATGAELSHPIAGVVPDSGSLLIKVS
jgi:hypothetical protein